MPAYLVGVRGRLRRPRIIFGGFLGGEAANNATNMG
jgi:hypothetical protein